MPQVVTLPPHYQTQFDDTWRLIMAQQTEHRLAGCYLEQTVAGKDFRFDQYGSSTDAMREKTGRAQVTNPADMATAFRWVRPRPYDKATIFDEHDSIALGKLPDPQGPITRTHAIAANRNKDLVLINGLLGTNYTGADGTTAVTLSGYNSGSQVIGVQFGNSSVNCGLTLKKLLEASFRMDANEIPQEGRIMGIAAKELNNLLVNVDQVNNALYNDVRALRDGRIKEFAGFSFRMSQLFPVASSIRKCVAWHPQLVRLGVGADPKTHVDILPDHSHAVQIRTVMLLDATRMEEFGVVEIDCDESV